MARAGASRGGWKQLLAGRRPLTAYDGMLRIPMIWRHGTSRPTTPSRPSGPKIPAGRRSDVLVSNYDFMPTLLD